jgi:hypothetical protein
METSGKGAAVDYMSALSWHIPSVVAIDRVDNNLMVVRGKNDVSMFR